MRHRIRKLPLFALAAISLGAGVFLAAETRAAGGPSSGAIIENRITAAADTGGNYAPAGRATAASATAAAVIETVVNGKTEYQSEEITAAGDVCLFIENRTMVPGEEALNTAEISSGCIAGPPGRDSGAEAIPSGGPVLEKSAAPDRAAGGPDGTARGGVIAAAREMEAKAVRPSGEIFTGEAGQTEEAAESDYAPARDKPAAGGNWAAWGRALASPFLFFWSIFTSFFN